MSRSLRPGSVPQSQAMLVDGTATSASRPAAFAAASARSCLSR